MTPPWPTRIRTLMEDPPKVIFHATTPKKLLRYQATGTILPPIRGWTTEKAAREFARRTLRSVILKLTLDSPAWPLPDHHIPEGLAFWTLSVVGWEVLPEKEPEHPWRKSK